MTEGKLIAAGQNNVPAKRILRADTKIADDEERGYLNIKLPESITNLFKAGTASTVTSKITAQDDQLVQMLKRGNSGEQTLHALRFTDDVNNVLTNANMNRLATYIGMLNEANRKAGKPAVTMIETLTTRYGTAPIARMLAEAKQVAGTSTLAKNLEGALINTWRLERKSNQEVFKLLEIKGVHDPNLVIYGAFKLGV
ncbi:hypothetical protein PF005_g26854 [Phytophthora fragariae]|uniref:RxLR effector protein n=1 Tax=Phytophthora fragariae TaxID=53985 RepID=A0A6A3VWE1_9STRA|nr:hypothetical protein PF003_g6975 [Phytophthora fragariae]KAE8922203.1 hypothetical protein PF009_g27530 [Phytophthora fragariae]KAE8972175.1 hypothetical protein PF011_g25736 [Phytophthora fragariae]KAE9070232.1 hypothetical protein PF010_g26359 [Phytophthora fragariae]KAE9070777.1 hypothetical protein PF007_g26811 [Phytophthora fragariae]